MALRGKALFKAFVELLFWMHNAAVSKFFLPFVLFNPFWLLHDGSTLQTFRHISQSNLKVQFLKSFTLYRTVGGAVSHTYCTVCSSGAFETLTCACCRIHSSIKPILAYVASRCAAGNGKVEAVKQWSKFEWQWLRDVEANSTFVKGFRVSNGSLHSRPGLLGAFQCLLISENHLFEN